eukprot:191817_1
MGLNINAKMRSQMKQLKKTKKPQKNNKQNDEKKRQDALECCSQDISACKCTNRIKMILDKFNIIIDEPNNEIAKSFNNSYTNTQLLNDFHHIKYDHNVDDDDNAFAKMYEYIT